MLCCDGKRLGIKFYGHLSWRFVDARLEIGYVEISPAGRCMMVGSPVLRRPPPLVGLPSVVDPTLRIRNGDQSHCTSRHHQVRVKHGLKNPVSRDSLSEVAVPQMLALSF